MLINSRTELSKLDTLAWLCVAIGAYFLPFVSLLPGYRDLLPGIYLWDWQRVFQACFLLCGLVVWALHSACSKAPTFPSLALLSGWATVAALGGLSVVVANYRAVALLDWAWMQALFALVLLSAGLSMRGNDQCNAWWLVPAGLSGLLYVFLFFVSNSDALFTYDFRFVVTVFPGFSNVRYFSDYQAVLLFIVPLAVQHYLPQGRARAMGWLLVGLFYMLAFLAGSRSILAGQIVAHLILLVFLRNNYWALLRTYLACWLLGLFLYVAIILIYAPWAVSLGAPSDEADVNAAIPLATLVSRNVSSRMDSSGRGQLLEKGRRLVVLAPWLGVGGRHYGCYLKADYVDPMNRFNGDAAHPHNAIVQIMAEWGVPMAVLLCLACIYLQFQVLRKLKTSVVEGNNLNYARLGALLALGVHAMVTGVLNAPVSQMLLVILLGWALSFITSMHIGAGLLVRRFMAVLMLVLGGLIGALFFAELIALTAANEAYSGENQITWYLAPRFWQQGWLLPLCGKI